MLAGSSLAHAEMNALAEAALGSEPAGLAALDDAAAVSAMPRSDPPESGAPRPRPRSDPLFRGIERARELNEFIGGDWPTFIELEVDEWSVFSLLLQTHVTTFWGVNLAGWNEALPSIKALAVDLVESGRLLELAGAGVSVDEVGTELEPKLVECIRDVAALAAI